MKNIILLLFTSITSILIAQEDLQKKYLILGGSLNFVTQKNYYPTSIFNLGGLGIYSSSDNENQYNSFGFSPYLAKEVNSNQMIGIQLNFNKSKNESFDVTFFGQNDKVDVISKDQEIGFGVFFRHIFKPENKYLTQNIYNIDYLVL